MGQPEVLLQELHSVCCLQYVNFILLAKNAVDKTLTCVYKSCCWTVVVPETHRNDRSYSIRELKLWTFKSPSQFAWWAVTWRKNRRTENRGVGACPGMGACPGQYIPYSYRCVPCIPVQIVHPHGSRATTLSCEQREHLFRCSISMVGVSQRPQFVVAFTIQPESDHNNETNKVKLSAMNTMRSTKLQSQQVYIKYIG